MPSALRFIQSQLEAADALAGFDVYTDGENHSKNSIIDSKPTEYQKKTRNDPKILSVQPCYHYTNILSTLDGYL